MEEQKRAPVRQTRQTGSFKLIGTVRTSQNSIPSQGLRAHSRTSATKFWLDFCWKATGKQHALAKHSNSDRQFLGAGHQVAVHLALRQSDNLPDVITYGHVFTSPATVEPGSKQKLS